MHTSEFPSTCSSHFSTTFSVAWPRTLVYQWLDHPPGQTHPASSPLISLHPLCLILRLWVIGYTQRPDPLPDYFFFFEPVSVEKLGLCETEKSPPLSHDWLPPKYFFQRVSFFWASICWLTRGAHDFQEVGLATDAGWRAKTIVFPLFHYQLAGRMHNPNRNCSFHRKAWGPPGDSRFSYHLDISKDFKCYLVRTQDSFLRSPSAPCLLHHWKFVFVLGPNHPQIQINHSQRRIWLLKLLWQSLVRRFNSSRVFLEERKT